MDGLYLVQAGLSVLHSLAVPIASVHHILALLASLQQTSTSLTPIDHHEDTQPTSTPRKVYFLKVLFCLCSVSAMVDDGGVEWMS